MALERSFRLASHRALIRSFMVNTKMNSIFNANEQYCHNRLSSAQLPVKMAQKAAAYFCVLRFRDKQSQRWHQRWIRLF
jgi:hypothetical protein